MAHKKKAHVKSKHSAGMVGEQKASHAKLAMKAPMAPSKGAKMPKGK